MRLARLSIAAATAFVLAGCSTSLPLQAPAPTTALSDAVEPQAGLRAMTIVADWQLANPSGHKPYEWQEGPFWAGLYQIALQSSRRQKYLDAVRRDGESLQGEPGAGPVVADGDAIAQDDVV